jgi:type VI secretion system protein ImpB
MAKEASVAPKERVNIRYKPATGDAKEQVELPMKLVMLGDYTMRADDRPLDQRERINVDKDNFNDVMREQKLSVDLNVKNKLTAPPEGTDEEDNLMGVNLQFNTLKDFEPEHVVEQVPELRKLLELRQALMALKGPLGNVPQFRKAIQAVLEDDAAREKLLSELGVGKDT